MWLSNDGANTLCNRKDVYLNLSKLAVKQNKQSKAKEVVVEEEEQKV